MWEQEWNAQEGVWERIKVEREQWLKSEEEEEEGKEEEGKEQEQVIRPAELIVASILREGCPHRESLSLIHQVVMQIVT